MTHQTEQAALAALFNGGWFHGGYVLDACDFTDRDNRAIFQAMKSIIDSGGEIDFFTVADRVGFDINHFATIYTRKTRISEYAENLKDETLQRELQKAAYTIGAGHGAGRDQLIQAQTLLASLEGKTIGSATPIGDHVDGWWAELGTRAEGGKWLRTGYPDLDNRIGGMRGGDLVILAGRPAMGKTALALNIAIKCRKQVAFFSLEMQAEGLLDRLAASLAQVELGTIRSGKLSDDEWHRVTEVSAKIRALPIHLDEQPGLTIEEIHARARSLKAKEGLSLVVVDYLQLIGGDRRASEYEIVSNASKKAKEMAKDLDVPVLMLSQLSRKCEERQDKRPMMSDLRASGSIEQDADVVSFVYRDEVYNENTPHKGIAELTCKKVRQGCTGTDWFLFDGAHQTFKQTLKPAQELRAVSGPGY